MQNKKSRSTRCRAGFLLAGFLLAGFLLAGFLLAGFLYAIRRVQLYSPAAGGFTFINRSNIS